MVGVNRQTSSLEPARNRRVACRSPALDKRYCDRLQYQHGTPTPKGGKMADVTIRLTGEQYRTLCTELEYARERPVSNIADMKSIANNHPAKRPAIERLARYDFMLERVTA